MTITASRDPLPLTRGDQEFWETTLPESAEDLPVLGAAARLLASSDAYTVQTRSVEAATVTSKVPPGAAQDQSKYLQALFVQRLNEERMRLLNTHSTRSRYQR